MVNSGAEAVENAVKVARAFTGRQAVVCFEHGFHGRTNLAMALTSKVMPYKQGFGPFAPEVYRIPYPYCYRCPRAEDGAAEPADAAWRTRRVLRTALRGPGGSRFGGRDRHGAGVGRRRLRPGTGGLRPRRWRLRPRSRHPLRRGRDPDRLRPHRRDVRLRALRSGPRHHHHREVAGRRAPPRRDHRPRRRDGRRAAGGLGGTYGGNPLACAAALAVLDAMERENIPERASRGRPGRGPVSPLGGAYPCIGDVRGLGAMVGMELVTDRDSRAPDKALDRTAARRRAPPRTDPAHGRHLRQRGSGARAPHDRGRGSGRRARSHGVGAWPKPPAALDSPTSAQYVQPIFRNKRSNLREGFPPRGRRPVIA